ncbi:MAG: hypothetical protein DCC44_08870 [Acidobacteria bacterium]|nr:MAG: hypothetical protein DCC44_08870 [Acidobacteriota bacterium]
MTAARSKSQLQEQLVSLYLRLNGFFVTASSSTHHCHGQNRAELDALALRLPYSCEPERQIGPDSALDLSEKYTDLSICEVKSNGQRLQEPIVRYFKSRSSEGPGDINALYAYVEQNGL